MPEIDSITRMDSAVEDYTDEELLGLFKKPGREHYAFNLLVNRYQQKAYYFVRKLVIDHEDANDIVQEVFMKLWQNLGSFRGESKFSTWLYRICSNQSFDHLKRKRKNIFQSIEDVQKALADHIDNDPLYDGEELRKQLDKAVLSLPHKQRLIFTLRYFEEKKFSEIAEITGTSEGALKAGYHHAVKKIEEIFSRN